MITNKKTFVSVIYLASICNTKHQAKCIEEAEVKLHEFFIPALNGAV
jgi:hypothetical protein